MIDVALGGDCGADSLFDEAGDFVDPDVSPAAQLDSIADLEFRCGFRRLVVDSDFARAACVIGDCACLRGADCPQPFVDSNGGRCVHSIS